MWEWLFGRKRPAPPPGQDTPEAVPSDPSSSFSAPTTLGPLVEEMKAKGYQGPFASLCADGIMVVVFHGPEVSLEPPWIEPTNNPFQMRVLDCEVFCQHSPMFAIGEGAESIDARFKQARHCQPQPIADALKIPCLLSYPRGGERIPDGAHFVAESMEDLWNVFLFDDHFYFTRSWTGRLRYRAKVLFRDRAMFMTEVEASRTGPTAKLSSDLEDEGLPVRQVDYLVKSLLYRLKALLLCPVTCPISPARSPCIP